MNALDLDAFGPYKSVDIVSHFTFRPITKSTSIKGCLSIRRLRDEGVELTTGGLSYVPESRLREEQIPLTLR